MEAVINTKSQRLDGTYDTYQTISVPVKWTTTLPWKGQTQSGDGLAVPTHFMVFYNGRWQRVKCVLCSDGRALYIGKKYSACLTVGITS